MTFKKVLQIFLGVVLIVLGVRVILFTGAFNVAAGAVIVILGVAMFFFEGSSAENHEQARETEAVEFELALEKEEKSSLEIEDDEPTSSKEAREVNGKKHGASRYYLVIFLIGILIFGVVEGAGVVGNWLSPEKELTEAELLQTLSDARMIKMQGRLKSTDRFTYLYVNDERVGTTVEKGWWDRSLQYQNKGRVLYTMSYSEHSPVEGDFHTYQYSGEESGILGYGQAALEDYRSVIYFYDAEDNPIGYVDVERSYAFYRDNWTVCDMEGDPIYDVTANYNPIDKQLIYTIIKCKESKVNVLQVMGLSFSTRMDIRDYYK
ncbi:MAG: hypothetical protein RR614_06805 [Eubacterium sp.]